MLGKNFNAYTTNVKKMLEKENEERKKKKGRRRERVLELSLLCLLCVSRQDYRGEIHRMAGIATETRHPNVPLYS